MRKKDNTAWKVFRFTFAQRLKTGGYAGAVIAGTVLCFLIPFLAMVCLEKFGGKESEKINPVTSVYVVEEDLAADAPEREGIEVAADAAPLAAEETSDMDAEVSELARDSAAADTGLQVVAGKTEVDYNSLNDLGREGYTGISYQTCGSFEEAAQAARGRENAMILVVEQEESSVKLNVVLPQDSNLSKSDLEGMEAFLGDAYSYIQVQRTGLKPMELAQLTAPVTVSSHRSAQEGADDLDALREALAYILPYLNIMVLYFLVLFYGQGVATSVLMEKTSKLMDTMLLAVRPGGMVLGKVLAQALAGALQIFAWLAGLVGGIFAGYFAVKTMNPNTTMILVQLLEDLGTLEGLFTAPAVLAALLHLLGGFLLYCALASIGGAAAGKQEELSSTNMLFTLVLVASFLLTLSGGGLGTMTPSSASLNWMPFSAVLLVPSRVLLGQISVWEAYGSLAVVLAAFVLIALFAGKVYQCMAMYKGKVPKAGELLRMMRG